MYPGYSVLMSVYKKESAEYLVAAVQSMLGQTVPPSDFVLVCDGPLTAGLDQAVSSFESGYPGLFQVVRLEENRGLAGALNEGLGRCRYGLVARMDSDDIALPGRCRLQLGAFEKDPGLALCSGDIAEFETEAGGVSCIRHVPRSHGEILTFARRRNPMNHVAVMYKKGAVEGAGGYVDVRLAEDYYLWVSMLQKGYRACTIGEVLVHARVGNGMHARRGGLGYVRGVLDLEGRMLGSGFITRREYLGNCAVRVAGGLAPVWARKLLYGRVLRGRL